METRLKTGFSERHMAPPPQLRRHVDRYTVITPDREVGGPLPWRILPEGHAHLLLHVYRDDEPSQLGFVGPRSVYADTDRRDRAFTLAVKFTTAGAAPFLRPPLCELADQWAPIEELWHDEGRELRDRLCEPADNDDLSACWRAIEAALLRRMQRVPLRPLAEAAVRVIEHARGCMSVRDVARGLGITERHLRGVLARHVGLGPKRLARIRRVTDTLREAEKHPRRHWASLAASGGYWDQSHMIEDFHALFGESPEAFVRRPNRE